MIQIIIYFTVTKNSFNFTGNRSLAYFKNKEYLNAANDGIECVKINPSFIKV